MDDDSRRGWYEVFALLAGCSLLAFARANRMTFPIPSKDEAVFYLPALWWAQHGSLNPATLNAPRGIFWMPDGFAVVLGFALRLFGETIQVARTTCECTVATGVTIFALVFRKLAGSWKMGALATLLLLTPPVLFAANQVRMEAPLFVFVAVVLLLHVNGYFFAASSLLFGSLLFHPALGLAAVGYAVVAWAMRKRTTESRQERILDWVIFSIVLVSFSLEGLRILHHIDLFQAHMSYQATRKASRSLREVLLKPQGVILLVSYAATALLLLRRRAGGRLSGTADILPVTIALGVLTYAVLGAEMAYDVYSLSVVPAIIFCLVGREFYAAQTGSFANRTSLI